MSTVDQLRAQIAHLQGERDEAKHCAQVARNGADEAETARRAAVARAEAAEAQVEALRAIVKRVAEGEWSDDGHTALRAAASATLASSQLESGTNPWRDIASAPKDRRQPILLIARYPTGRDWTDIYHCWWDDICWARWPHRDFGPTHWMPVVLPGAPARSEKVGDGLDWESIAEARAEQLKDLGVRYTLYSMAIRNAVDILANRGRFGIPDDALALLKGALSTEAAPAEARSVEAELREEIANLKSSVISFCAPWAVTYARDYGLPEGTLHATHYDILARCGARMVDFKRHDPTPPKAEAE